MILSDYVSFPFQFENKQALRRQWFAGVMGMNQGLLPIAISEE
jgi:hypothetical protein